MARRGARRRDPLDPPWWFDLVLFAVIAVVAASVVWPLGWAAHTIWSTFLDGWRST